jgi:hypothetical protein
VILGLADLSGPKNENGMVSFRVFGAMSPRPIDVADQFIELDSHIEEISKTDGKFNQGRVMSVVITVQVST